jgi:hypothetical protein
MAGPRVVVSGPTFTPLPYGLWDVAQHPEPGDSHWQNGVTWVDRCGSGDTLYEECIAVTGSGGSPTAQASMASNVTQTNRGATAFACYAEFDCSPVGLADAQGIAETALAKVRNYQLEKAFWTGVAGKTKTGNVAQTTVFPHLAANAQLLDPNDGSIVLQPAASQAASGGATTDVADGLGQLENALAGAYHGQGVIHIPAFAIQTFAAWDLVEEDSNGNLTTPLGNKVVVGHGYPGTSPAGVAPAAGTSWIYGTGAVFGYNASIEVGSLNELFDRTENTHHMIAQQVYVLGFECALFATQVQIGVPT